MRNSQKEKFKGVYKSVKTRNMVSGCMISIF
jgi:hypothetical protein